MSRSEATQMLLEEFRPRVVSSVDALEVAVLLEAAGISDTVAQDRCGEDDVLALATVLRSAVTPVADVPVAHPADWYGPYWLSIVRGCAYVFVGLIAMTAAGLVVHPFASEVVLGASAISSALMSWLSYLGHTVTQRAAPGRKGQALGPLLVVGMVVAALVGGLTALLTTSAVGLLAAGPLLYASVAVVLLVLGRHRLFAIAILPGGLASLAHLALRDRGPSAQTAVAISLVGVAVLVLAAIVAVRPRRGTRAPIGSLDLRSSVPYAWAGLSLAAVVCGLLVAFSSLQPMQYADDRAWFVLALPLFLPLMVADAAVIAFHRRVRSTSMYFIQPEQLAQCARRYAAQLWTAQALVGAACVAVVVWAQPIEERNVAIVVSLGFLFLGSVMVTSLLAGDGRGAPARRRALLVVATVLAIDGVFAAHGQQTMTTAVVAAVAMAGGAMYVSLRFWRDSAYLVTYRWIL